VYNTRFNNNCFEYYYNEVPDLVAGRAIKTVNTVLCDWLKQTVKEASANFTPSFQLIRDKF
jgi:hypothetical protein